MNKTQYRVESSHTIVCPFVPPPGVRGLLFNDRALAIVVAAKSLTRPHGQEIRVVNTLSGEVVYRKAEGRTSLTTDE